MASVIVVGGGLVGSVMAADMARTREHEVAIADRSGVALDAAVKRAKRIGSNVTSCRIDLSNALT